MKGERYFVLDVGKNLVLTDQKLTFSLKKPYDALLLPTYSQDLAAGLGFEPRLRGPEPRVLPLDDPARRLISES